MFRRVLASGVFAAMTVAAEVAVPIDHIDIGAARKAFSGLPAGERNIACDDPALAQHRPALQYCSLIRNLVDPTAATVSFAIFATQDQSLLSSFISGVADSNLGTHLGSSASSPGTATLVERTGFSDVLGLAVESGAVTQSVSGTTINLQANALSLYRFVANEDVFQYCAGGTMSCQGAAASVLNRISGSAALSVAGVTTESVTGTVGGSSADTPATALIETSATHLTGATLHIQLWNSLDLRSKTYIDAWKTAVGGQSVAAAAKTAEQDTKAFDWFDLTKPRFRNWLREADVHLRAAIESGKDDAAVSSVIQAQWNGLAAIAKTDPAYSVTAFQQFLKDARTYLAARDAAINTARRQTQSGLSLEYCYSRPVSQPRISTLRLAYTLHPGVLRADKAAAAAAAPARPPKLTNDFAVSFNAAAELYDSPPAGTGMLRDVQAAIQLDRHFGNTIGTLAAYYQYQKESAAITIGPGNLAPNTNIVLPGGAATLLAPKGNLVVIQGKVTFALKSGASIPAGITWANRTELTQASEVRGHFGLDFDWSSLFASAKSKL
ncbi:MAG TPA: hypothetical protein VMH81_14430 [Bryobacteraceae bacterium]|nr:hypothetical protein [Bryobacteraceae bacterium]